MDMIEETVTVPAEEHFLMNAEHCEVCMDSTRYLPFQLITSLFTFLSGCS